MPRFQVSELPSCKYWHTGLDVGFTINSSFRDVQAKQASMLNINHEMKY
jgi:hypothetical protein